MVKEIADAVAIVSTTLSAARDANRAKDSNRATWIAFESQMRPHLNTLENYARRGMLDDNARDLLYSAMVSWNAWRNDAVAPIRGRRY